MSELNAEIKKNAIKGLDKNGKSLDDLVAENSENIDAWKAKHKQVKAISAMSELNGLVHFIIGMPTRQMLDSMAQYDSDGKVKKSQDVLFNSSILAGDKSLLPGDINLQTTVGVKIGEFVKRLEVLEKEL